MELKPYHYLALCVTIILILSGFVLMFIGIKEVTSIEIPNNIMIIENPKDKPLCTKFGQKYLKTIQTLDDKKVICYHESPVKVIIK